MNESGSSVVPKPSIYLKTSVEWRAWLAENHEKEKEIWLIFYKCHTSRTSIPYERAVEEALCFGWVDSLIRRIDDERYARKFTPRKLNSRWSESNKRRILKLIDEGRMTEAGQIHIENINFDKDERPFWQQRKYGIPEDIIQPMQANAKAWANFNKLPPSQRRNYIGWIISAKKEETRERRLTEALELLERGEPLGMK